MNYEIYYRKTASNNYIVHFPNYGMTNKEVHTLFSSYGNVKSIDSRGQTEGLCFVTYGSKEGARRCIIAMENHQKVKILPHKSQMKKTYAKSTPFRRSSLNSINNDSIGNVDSQSDCSTTTSYRVRNKPALHDPAIYSEDLSDVDMIGSRNNISADSNCTQEKSFGERIRELRKLRKTTPGSSVSSVTANNRVKALDKVINVTDIAPMVSNDQTVAMNSSKRIISAQEVIVANIHPSFGIHYILNLFEKYNPLSISLMRIVVRTRLKYCHVYFETVEEALATEKEFDGLPLHGKSLIVLTPQRLIRESLSI